MIKLLISLTLGLMLASCGSTKYIFPNPPPTLEELPKDMEKVCPPIPPIEDKRINTLGKADIALSFEYARCKNRHKSVVQIYTETKKLMDAYVVEYEKSKKEAKNK